MRVDNAVVSMLDRAGIAPLWKYPKYNHKFLRLDEMTRVGLKWARGTNPHKYFKTKERVRRYMKEGWETY